MSQIAVLGLALPTTPSFQNQGPLKGVDREYTPSFQNKGPLKGVDRGYIGITEKPDTLMLGTLFPAPRILDTPHSGI